MLVLTRGKNEVITIGEDITITILEIRGEQVRLGIKAPRSVVILRDDAQNRTQGGG